MRKQEREPDPPVLVQTRLPLSLFKWVVKEAERTHLSVAAWMRLRVWELYDLERNAGGPPSGKDRR